MDESVVGEFAKGESIFADNRLLERLGMNSKEYKEAFKRFEEWELDAYFCGGYDWYVSMLDEVVRRINDLIAARGRVQLVDEEHRVIQQLLEKRIWIKKPLKAAASGSEKERAEAADYLKGIIESCEQELKYEYDKRVGRLSREFEDINKNIKGVYTWVEKIRDGTTQDLPDYVAWNKLEF